MQRNSNISHYQHRILTGLLIFVGVFFVITISCIKINFNIIKASDPSISNSYLNSTLLFVNNNIISGISILAILLLGLLIVLYLFIHKNSPKNIFNEENSIFEIGHFIKIPYGQMKWDISMNHILGIHEKEISSKELFKNLTHPSDINVLDKKISDAISRKKDNIALRLRIIRPDKSVRNLLIFAKIIHKTDQNTAKIIGTVQDITNI